MAYLSAAVLGATTTFTSCGSNNDDSKGEVVETGTKVNPLKVFTGGLPKSIAGMTIQTNEKRTGYNHYAPKWQAYNFQV